MQCVVTKKNAVERCLRLDCAREPDEILRAGELQRLPELHLRPLECLHIMDMTSTCCQVISNATGE
jgi:hypothetical protein